MKRLSVAFGAKRHVRARCRSVPFADDPEAGILLRRRGEPPPLDLMNNLTSCIRARVVRGANMSISTRLTELLKVKHPILLAPMDVVSDGRLAATVSRAG